MAACGRIPPLSPCTWLSPRLCFFMIVHGNSTCCLQRCLTAVMSVFVCLCVSLSLSLTHARTHTLSLYVYKWMYACTHTGGAHTLVVTSDGLWAAVSLCLSLLVQVNKRPHTYRWGSHAGGDQRRVVGVRLGPLQTARHKRQVLLSCPVYSTAINR